jgi:hypothetical protein
MCHDVDHILCHIVVDGKSHRHVPLSIYSRYHRYRILVPHKVVYMKCACLHECIQTGRWKL